MDKHRDKLLDALIGRVVEVMLYDGSIFKGVLGFTEEFSAKYDYLKPGFYTCDNHSFRKSHVLRVK